MTTDKTPTDALLPCPFCGAPAHGYAIAPHSHSPAVLRLVPELPDHPGSYVIEGQCACGSGLIGANEAEVVARWNTRAKWGTPAGAVEPWGACVSGRVFVGGLPDHVRKMAEADNLPIQWLYTAPQPTQAQAGAVPLKYARLHAISLDYSDSEDECTGFRDGWRAAEKHHGIKGADHG